MHACSPSREYTAILESLQQLRAAGSAPKVFGSETHGFKLNAPLTEEAVTQFESGHGVRLPEDYRGFLIRVGNGGAGPAYGMFRLLEMDDGHGTCRWRENNGFVGILSQPFPHTEAWNDLTNKPHFEEADIVNEADEDEKMAKIDAWEENHYWNSRHVNGAIPICHLGCAIRQWLVITGDEAGHVWNDQRVGEKGLSPVQFGVHKRVSFLQWYRSWLEDALEKSAIRDA